MADGQMTTKTDEVKLLAEGLNELLHPDIFKSRADAYMASISKSR